MVGAGRVGLGARPVKRAVDTETGVKGREACQWVFESVVVTGGVGGKCGRRVERRSGMGGRGARVREVEGGGGAGRLGGERGEGRIVMLPVKPREAAAAAGDDERQGSEATTV